MSIENADNFNIPTDPGTLQKIKNGLQEVSNSKLRAKAETDLQTDIFTRLAEETGVPNRVLRKLATVQAEGGVDKLQTQVDNLAALHEAVNKPLNQQLEEQGGTKFSEESVQQAIEEHVNNG